MRKEPRINLFLKAVAGLFLIVGITGAVGYAWLNPELRGYMTAVVILLYALIVSGFVYALTVVIGHLAAIRRALEYRDQDRPGAE